MTNFRNIYSSDLSHRARSVYMYLKDRADKDDKCWPAIKTIAKELGLSSSTVKRALDELCQAGLLTKESRWRRTAGVPRISTGSPDKNRLSPARGRVCQFSELGSGSW